MASQTLQETQGGGISMSLLLDHPLKTTKGQGLRALSFGNQPGAFYWKKNGLRPALCGRSRLGRAEGRYEVRPEGQ